VAVAAANAEDITGLTPEQLLRTIFGEASSSTESSEATPMPRPGWKTPATREQLPPEEEEILREITFGRTAEEIGKVRGSPPQDVRAVVERGFEKLGPPPIEERPCQSLWTKGESDGLDKED
jgi:hypothetical protein